MKMFKCSYTRLVVGLISSHTIKQISKKYEVKLENHLTLEFLKMEPL